MCHELSLHSRLRNCLQTILDMKDAIASAPFGVAFVDEIGMIGGFMRQIDQVELSEADVLRIEGATVAFLRELAGLLAKEKVVARKGDTRLQ